jgi:N-acetylglucosamine-6-phosphate deacetylase
MLSPARAGAHDPAHLRLPADVDTGNWRPSGGVRMVTLAPELPGGLEVAAQLLAEGVVVAAGHTDADAACSAAAVNAGVRHATHLLNAMRGLEPREPGIATGLLLDERVTVGLIVDGHHLAPATIALLWRAAGSSRVVVTTDGIAALGIGAGPHRLGDRDLVVSDDGSARLDDGRLAGAVVTLPQALRNLHAATDCTLAEALATVTKTPARVLGLQDRGHLRPGARADAVLLDDDLHPVATFVGGDPVHGAEALRWG